MQLVKQGVIRLRDLRSLTHMWMHPFKRGASRLRMADGDGRAAVHLNRQYRALVNRFLTRPHRLTDRFLSAGPLNFECQFRRAASPAKEFSVVLGTHRSDLGGRRFLAGGEV
jgi:hypothetical protein